ncbi:MAG: dihydroneopterin aldolase [Chitinophagales bacterium]
MVTVELRNVIMHGHHGIYAEEQEVMNTFEVNLDVSYDESDLRFEGLNDTISYVALFDIIQEIIKVPVFLLEKICGDTITKIKTKYPQVRAIQMSIYKLQAPIENFQGKVGVTMHRHFDD